MPDSNLYFVLFHTIHDVLKAEKILKQHGVKHELVPVPRNLSSDCGMCVKLEDEIDAVLPLFCKLEVAGCYFPDGRQT